MDPATITTANFTVTGPGGTVTGTVAYVAASQIATFTPATNLTTNTFYTATITTGQRTWPGMHWQVTLSGALRQERR